MDKHVVCVAVFFSLRNQKIEVDSELMADVDYDINKLQVAIPLFFKRLKFPFKVSVEVGILPKTCRSYRPCRTFDDLAWDITASLVCFMANDYKLLEDSINGTI